MSLPPPRWCYEPVIDFELVEYGTVTMKTWKTRPCKQQVYRVLTEDGKRKAVCQEHAPRRPIPEGR